MGSCCQHRRSIVNQFPGVRRAFRQRLVIVTASPAVLVEALSPVRIGTRFPAGEGFFPKLVGYVAIVIMAVQIYFRAFVLQESIVPLSDKSIQPDRIAGNQIRAGSFMGPLPLSERDGTWSR